eukprot:TRINITY_DN3858_c0_g1_i1.p1 TRINITY_DN3858_c0_g1~~TRINITY_DN3858_c0_g1_i1.p1  ORF type:complete len:352 (+),score=45.10 TRINITY_DN3858_c0_g1_i1:218-1273(+)
MQSVRDMGNEDLLPGLPNDLALQCLVRVPRRYHGVMRGVSKAWAELVSYHHMHWLRKQLGFSEGWLYTLSRDQTGVIQFHVLDPYRRQWRELPKLPDNCLNRYGMSSEVLEGQLYVMGGGGKYQNPTAEVYRYNPLTNRWAAVAHMREARCHFVSGAFQGRLYAIGGMGVTSGVLTSWEIYDPRLDEWCLHLDPNIVSDLGEALVFDGKIFIRHVSPDNLPPFYAAIYDASQNVWSPVDDDMAKKWCGPTAVVANKDVYMLDQTYGLKLMRLEKEKGHWEFVGRISPFSTRGPCKIATVGKNLYIVGRGLRTVVVNTDNTGDGGLGLLLASSISGLKCSDDIVLSCNILEL